MALDFSAMRDKLAKSQQKGGNKKDFSKIYFKPTSGIKQKVRIVPWKEDKSNPFIEVQLHRYDTFKRYLPTLANWNEEDPILKFRRKVYDDPSSTEEDKLFMKNFTPRNATFVQVIVRGQEDDGVKLWDLNVTNFQAVAALLVEEEEYGDITSITDGRDLIVEGYNEVNPKTGKPYTAVNIKVAAKQTPLSTDASLAKKWLEEQHVPLEQYTRKSAAELKQLLENFLNPADEPNEDDEDAAPAPKPTPKAPAKAPVKQVFAKVEEVEPEEEPEEAPAPKPKAKAKPAPVAVPDDLPWEGGDDELAEAIPVAPKAQAKAPVKKPAAAPAPKATPAASVASKFAELYDDEED